MAAIMLQSSSFGDDHNAASSITVKTALDHPFRLAPAHFYKATCKRRMKIYLTDGLGKKVVKSLDDDII